MTNDFPELDVKNQASLEGVNFTAGGDLVLNQLGIDLATPQLADISPWEFAHYMAVENWLTEYQPKPDSSNLEQVRGYLEAFDHLCEVSDWEKASKILFIHLNLAHSKALHEQLGTWGYYREQIEFYINLLHKVNRDLDCICLHGLGWAYCHLGQPRIAIDYHQRLLDVACEIQNRKAEAQARGGLGRIYFWCLDRFEIALQHYQEKLKIAGEICDRQQEIEALDGLASVYSVIGQHQKSIKYCQQALVIASEIGEVEMEVTISATIGSTYRLMGRPDKGLEFFQQILDAPYKIRDRHQEWSILHDTGAIYCTLGKHQNAIEYLEKALQIIQELGDKFGESWTLASIGATYARSGHYDTAIGYFQPLLTISHLIGNRFLEGFTSSNISYCYGCLKQHKKAIRYAKLAMKIAREINDQQLKAASVITLACAYWYKGEYLRGLVLAVRAILIIPPWKSENGKLIFNTVIQKLSQPLERIGQYFLTLFQFKNRNKKPT
ncbi:tetratricopeptide repeat protein [Argonema antarcticum]|uniref:tetratricopeptide repeat protein n=1 Tax=Argonema antarcticum TaxID=2942763 RepID=UPI002012C076|nr:tetratricopeptide repeat protein [Argonema antarcticum]MCL1471051.1 tetratricopeptide repeat protein [Argonema antarcticum A004/B2]